MYYYFAYLLSNPIKLLFTSSMQESAESYLNIRLQIILLLHQFQHNKPKLQIQNDKYDEKYAQEKEYYHQNKIIT